MQLCGGRNWCYSGNTANCTFSPFRLNCCLLSDMRNCATHFHLEQFLNFQPATAAPNIASIPPIEGNRKGARDPHARSPCYNTSGLKDTGMAGRAGGATGAKVYFGWVVNAGFHTPGPEPHTGFFPNRAESFSLQYLKSKTAHIHEHLYIHICLIYRSQHGASCCPFQVHSTVLCSPPTPSLWAESAPPSPWPGSGSPETQSQQTFCRKLG